MDGQPPHFHGHRQRLRDRFVKSGLMGFADHEVIELLLTLVIPSYVMALRRWKRAPPTGLQSILGASSRPPYDAAPQHWSLRTITPTVTCSLPSRTRY